MLIAVASMSGLLAGHEQDLVNIAAAVNYQLRRHVAPLWDRHNTTVTYYGDAALIPADADQVLAFDDEAQMNALGYHWETPDGKPYGRVLVKPILDAGGTMTTGALSLSAVFSHECLELWCDPDCNLWAESPNGDEFAYELCDAVENDSYVVHVGANRVPVSVSNFCTPSWFDSQPKPGAIYDYLKKLSAPFTMTSGGYVIKKVGGQVTEVFADKPGPVFAAKGKVLESSRTARRHRGAKGPPTARTETQGK